MKRPPRRHRPASPADPISDSATSDDPPTILPARSQRGRGSPGSPACSHWLCPFHHILPRLSLLVLLLPGAITAWAGTQLDEPDTQLPRSVVQLFCFGSATPEPQDDPPLNPLTHGYGVVVAENTILTTRHLLVEPEFCRYFLKVAEGRELVPAKPWALDAWSDLAILKADTAGLQVAPIAEPLTTESLLSQTLTVYPAGTRQLPFSGPGELYPRPSPNERDTPSANRFDSLASDSLYQYGGLLRIPARFLGFQSGGGVFDDRGRLVGLTTALVPTSESAPDIIVIPLDAALQAVVARLISDQGLPEYGFLGVTPRNLGPQQMSANFKGVQIIDVVTHSPADAAGLRFTDVITQLDETRISSTQDYYRFVTSRQAGATIRVRGRRGRLSVEPVESIDVQVRLSKRRLETRRSSWSRIPLPGWRGLQVEYPFAIPRFQLLIPSLNPAGCVVVSQVEPDSAAWQAGVRPRSLVGKIQGRSVSTPGEFYREVNRFPDQTVTLELVDSDTGETSQLTIPSQPTANR